MGGGTDGWVCGWGRGPPSPLPHTQSPTAHPMCPTRCNWSAGVISGTGREISSGNTGRPIQDVIQTDAAINPGQTPSFLCALCVSVAGQACVPLVRLAGAGSFRHVGRCCCRRRHQ